MRTLLPLILLVFASSVLGSLNLTFMNASAVTSPYIGVVPESTVDPALTPGMNYTISVYTDYNGDDVWGYEFKLAFNPNVLEGVEVVNGDLITEDIGITVWIPGTFDNTAGTLSLTGNVFFKIGVPKPLTSGPGTLANITFRVVGIGNSNITLETQGPERTKLIGYTDGGSGEVYNIIDPETMPDQIQHGYLENVLTIHDVAVISLDAPIEALLGDLVDINVTVANEGNFTETFNVTVYANTNEIGTQKVTDLASGYSTSPLAFSWNTADATGGNYTLTANATVLQSIENPEGIDEDPTDNTKTAKIKLKIIHNVAVTNIEFLEPAIIGSPMPVNVTVANQGHYNENVTLMVVYIEIREGNIEVPIDNATANFTLNKGLSQTVSFKWNTTGLDPGWFRINATATIPLDANLGDNTQNKKVKLTLGHDVAVKLISADTSVYVGELVAIRVMVGNLGGYNETFEVKVTYDTSTIEKPENVTWAKGESDYIEFSWDTTGVEPGSYTITAEAILPEGIEDVNPNNNVKTISIDVLSPLPGSIVGKVTDSSTGEAIAGANVTANGMSTITNSSGAYIISNLPPGTYTVTASATGYPTVSKSDITVFTEEATTVDFELTPVQQLNILLYAALTVVAIITVAGIAVYILRIRKRRGT